MLHRLFHSCFNILFKRRCRFFPLSQPWRINFKSSQNYTPPTYYLFHFTQRCDTWSSSSPWGTVAKFRLFYDIKKQSSITMMLVLRSQQKNNINCHHSRLVSHQNFPLLLSFSKSLQMTLLYTLTYWPHHSSAWSWGALGGSMLETKYHPTTVYSCSELPHLKLGWKACHHREGGTVIII